MQGFIRTRSAMIQAGLLLLIISPITLTQKNESTIDSHSIFLNAMCSTQLSNHSNMIRDADLRCKNLTYPQEALDCFLDNYLVPSYPLTAKTWMEIICTESGRERKFTRQKSCLSQFFSVMNEDQRETIQYDYNILMQDGKAEHSMQRLDHQRDVERTSVLKGMRNKVSQFSTHLMQFTSSHSSFPLIMQ